MSSVRAYTGSRHVAWGDTGKYWRWLEAELPPGISQNIASVKHHGNHHPRTKRRIIITFYSWPGQDPTTVVIKRKGFKSPATIAHICLMAP